MKRYNGFLYIVRRIQKDIGLMFQIILLLIILNLLGKSLYSSYNDRRKSSSNPVRAATSGIELSQAIEESQKLFEEEQTLNSKHSRRKARELIYSAETNDDRAQDIPPSLLLDDESLKRIEPPPPIAVEALISNGDKRLKLLQTQCRKLNLAIRENRNGTRNFSSSDMRALASLSDEPLYQSLLVSEKHHLSYCPVEGSGSKWMSQRLLQVIDSELRNTRPQDVQKISAEKFPFLSPWSKYQKILKSSTNFLVVRHPFDRLIEAYKRNFEEVDPLADNVYRQYAPFIIKMYRKNLPVVIYPYYYASKKPTFEEFCHFIIDQATLQLQNSWKSISLLCTPCNIPYNAIVDYETMFQEVVWYLQRIGKPIKTQDYIYYGITPEVRQNYFSQISKEDIGKLYDHYILDFDLFGYGVEGYLQYSANEDASAKSSNNK